MVCIACRDMGPCKGGGNRECRKRDPRPSVCASILDTYGGVRFIVTHRSQLKHHKRHDETVIVVPDLIVHEPIVWGDIPGLIRRCETAIDEWLARGTPNEPHAREAAIMYRLRRQETPRRSLDLYTICET